MKSFSFLSKTQGKTIRSLAITLSLFCFNLESFGSKQSLTSRLSNIKSKTISYSPKLKEKLEQNKKLKGTVDEIYSKYNSYAVSFANNALNLEKIVKKTSIFGKVFISSGGKKLRKILRIYIQESANLALTQEKLFASSQVSEQTLLTVLTKTKKLIPFLTKLMILREKIQPYYSKLSKKKKNDIQKIMNSKISKNSAPQRFDSYMIMPIQWSTRIPMLFQEYFKVKGNMTTAEKEALAQSRQERQKMDFVKEIDEWWVDCQLKKPKASCKY